MSGLVVLIIIVAVVLWWGFWAYRTIKMVRKFADDKGLTEKEAWDLLKKHKKVT